MDAEKFTGERPGWGEGFDYDYARHVAAYRFAATKAVGKSVLDAGCGEGFGTHTLADVAAEVLGVDYSPLAISECQRLWNKPNLRFQQVNLTEQGSFTETFDLMINFQVIEHITDPLPFLKGLHQRLAPTGTLILTTPNRLRTVSENPYHVREYTAAELTELLKKVFGNVEMTGMHGNAKVEEFESGRARAVQRILRLDPLGIRNMLPEKLVHFAFAKLARIVRRQARPTGTTDMVPEDFFVSAESIDRALDLVAICSR